MTTTTVFDPIATGIWRAAALSDGSGFHDSAPDIPMAGTLWVGCNFPPEIADLDRVVLGEGRDELGRWRAEGPNSFLFDVAITRPVRCAFTVRYRLPEHQAILHDIAYDGYLLICNTAHPGAPARVVWWQEFCYEVRDLLPTKPPCA